MDATVWRARLHHTGAPYAILAAALLLTPVAGLLGVLATRIEYSRNPPPCYGIGWGCSLDPGSTGIVAAIAYGAFVVAASVLVTILLVGGRRLALARSYVALVAVLFVWAFIAVAMVATLAG